MSRFRAISTAAALLLVSIPLLAKADPGPQEDSWFYQSGKTLLAACEAYLDLQANPDKPQNAKFYFNAGKCSGAIQNTSDILTLHKDALSHGWLPVACLSEKLHTEVLVKTVVEYGKHHPEYNDAIAQTVIRNALAEKYPCSDLAPSIQSPAAVCGENEDRCG